MNTLTWDGIEEGRKSRRSSYLSPGDLTVEFDRTKLPKIMVHKLGNVEFSDGRDVNPSRQKIIDREISNSGYNSVLNVHSPHAFTSSDSGVVGEYSYEVYAHGARRGASGTENCASLRMRCASGFGTDSSCQRGKCVIGSIIYQGRNKWLYESEATFSPGGVNYRYYFAGGDVVRLRSVLRGKVDTFRANGEPVTISVASPASVASTIYLPPIIYSGIDLVERALLREDARLSENPNSSGATLVGVEDRRDEFVREVMNLAYPGVSGGFINNRLNDPSEEAVKNAILEIFSGIAEPWRSYVESTVEDLFKSSHTNIQLILDCFNNVSGISEKIIQILPSSFSMSAVDYAKERIARPVYSRLPGIAEAYRSDASFSDVETPSQWLTSGVDEFLSGKKNQIASFYESYLDEETCNPVMLDWLAQHLGLFGRLWNSEWDRGIKTAMIRNAFGWWDRGTENAGRLTPKGRALSLRPFSEPWVESPESDNSVLVDYSEIERINVGDFSRSIKGYEYRFIREASEDGDSVTLESIPDVRFYSGKWNGLMEAKGSLLGVAFLTSLFGLKSHVPTELDVKDGGRLILAPRSGLRNSESSAPILLPTKSEVLQVGDERDVRIGNYSNQLVAGISRAVDVEDSRNVFFRVPYYYNRDGKSWDRVTYIAENWLPSNLNSRVQYAYLSADLWAVGDAFFEPDVVLVEEPPVERNIDGALLIDDDRFLATQGDSPISIES